MAAGVDAVLTAVGRGLVSPRGGLRRQRDLDTSVVRNHAEPKVDRS